MLPATSVTSFARVPRLRLVHDVASAPAAARACREAGIAFVRGTTSGWGRSELATWLVCHYAPSVVDGDDGGDAGPRRACGITVVDEAAIESVILEARAKVLRTLSELTVRDRATALARTLLAKGEVIAVRDHTGAVAHAPVDRPRMTLAARVVSLFVADWLNDPLTYREVNHCSECGDVALGRRVQHDPSCGARDGRSTVTMTGRFRKTVLEAH